MELFLTGFLLSLSLCLDMGIVNLALIRTAMTRGTRAAFMVGLGSCFGDLAYAGTATIGVATLMQFTFMRRLFWILGTIALIWLAWRMLCEALTLPEHKPDALDAQPFKKGDFITGLGLAITSPSSFMWFAAVGGSLVAAATQNPAVRSGNSLAIFFAGFFTCGLIWSAGLAWLASRSSKLGPAFVRDIAGLSCALFIYFAFKIFIDGWKTLL